MIFLVTKYIKIIFPNFRWSIRSFTYKKIVMFSSFSHSTLLHILLKPGGQDPGCSDNRDMREWSENNAVQQWKSNLNDWWLNSDLYLDKKIIIIIFMGPWRVQREQYSQNPPLRPRCQTHPFLPWIKYLKIYRIAKFLIIIIVITW